MHIDELDLFGEKYSGQLYQYQNLTALLEYSPHVAPLVTRFGIRGKSDSMTNFLMDTSLFPILQSLRNLFHIEFISSTYDKYWIQFPLATRRLFLAALRSLPLKTLILKRLDFRRNALFEDVFAAAAAANPALKHLSFVCHYGGAGTSQPYPLIRPPPSGLPALESLSISGPTTHRNIRWLFLTRSLYSVSGIRRLSLQLSNGTSSSLIQSLLNEMKETLECFTVDICPQTGGTVCFDLSRHRNLSSFHAIVTDLPGPDSIPGMRLPLVRPWVEVDRLPLPALEHVYIKLHDSVRGDCYINVQCNTCELQVQQKTDPGDLDSWKRQVEERMPLLKDRGILEVKVVKQRYCISTAFD
ncbi:hypothetical protein ARMGADRAFT_1090586 [Armillaria gallica]|uniref:F-box domain-containing protein n=1 Tax=Armillaria gallica TaxID=47427 RepID=A0A2H3CLI2_ARMGA|nr:hypothetical protein ARMGADRAFT_1090586 [Armillaria gallica]